MQDTCIVYRMSIANQLLDQGFKLVHIAVNKQHPKYTVYHFEKTEGIEQAIKQILKELPRS